MLRRAGAPAYYHAMTATILERDAPDESKRRQLRLLAASEHYAADDPGSWEVAQAVWVDLEAIGRAYHRGDLDEAALEARLTAVYDPLSLDVCLCVLELHRRQGAGPRTRPRPPSWRELRKDPKS